MLECYCYLAATAPLTCLDYVSGTTPALTIGPFTDYGELIDSIVPLVSPDPDGDNCIISFEEFMVMILARGSALGPNSPVTDEGDIFGP